VQMNRMGTDLRIEANTAANTEMQRRGSSRNSTLNYFLFEKYKLGTKIFLGESDLEEQTRH
jgi:hypothetical protein